jgi:hypothetical protein
MFIQIIHRTLVRTSLSIQYALITKTDRFILYTWITAVYLTVWTERTTLKRYGRLSCVNFWVVLRRMVFNSRRFGTLSVPSSWNKHSVPKRRLLNTLRRKTTQKDTHDIQNTAKAWNQEGFSCYIWLFHHWNVTKSQRNIICMWIDGGRSFDYR